MPNSKAFDDVGAGKLWQTRVLMMSISAAVAAVSFAVDAAAAAAAVAAPAVEKIWANPH